MTDHNFMRRMTPFLVLEILKNHTDEEHGLQVSQIVELLQQDYAVTAERKAVSRILSDLWDLAELPEEYNWKRPMPYTILCDTTHRRTGDIRGNWRLCKPFEDVEVRLMMDAVRTVHGYPTDHVMKKLQQLGSFALQKDSAVFRTAAAHDAVSSHMPYSMDAIARAIRDGKKLMFAYGNTSENDTVSPYKMVLRNGVYYLICCEEQREVLAHFRIDMMHHTTVVDAPAKDWHTVKGISAWQYDLEKYMDYHIPLSGCV